MPAHSIRLRTVAGPPRPVTTTRRYVYDPQSILARIFHAREPDPHQPEQPRPADFDAVARLAELLAHSEEPVVLFERLTGRKIDR